jgi:hypothetical protein
MAFKPQRQSRKEKLEANGFLPSEASSLSRLGKDGLDHRYVKQMIRDRYTILKRIQRQNGSESDLKKAVMDDYVNKHIITKSEIRLNKDGTLRIPSLTGKGKLVNDKYIWRLFAKYEQDDHDKVKQGQLPPEGIKSPTLLKKARRSSENKATKYDQSIKKHQEELDRYKSRLSFPATAPQKKIWQDIVDRHESKIAELTAKKAGI